jgi:subtilase family serine protease
MNDKTGRRPDPRRAAAALAVVAGVAMVTAACGVHISFGHGGGASAGARTRVSTGPAGYQAELAYARCMQTHGVPDFPDPSPSQGAHISTHLNASGSAARAVATCAALRPGSGQATPATGSPSGAGATGSPSGVAATDCLSAQPPCYTPQQLRVAYGVQPLLDRGITGRGQSIVLLEFPPPAARAPSPVAAGQVPAVTDIRQDLARFDATFALPAAQLQVVNTLARAASPWLATGEEVEDTEIVHAIAPGAAIREVLIPAQDTAAPDTAAAAVVAAVRLGLTQGAVISLSAGEGEQCFTPAAAAQVNAALQAAQSARVTVVISTSDYGAATTCPSGAQAPFKGVDLPASDPLALAVGGTSLQASQATGAYIGETAWNTPGGSGPRASGGGFSKLFPRPAYQAGVTGIGATTRGVPDVAADADPATGMALVFSDGDQGDVVIGAGGTSAATPLWAAVVTLADQYAGHPLGFVNPAIYQIGHDASYHQAFHDISTGTNTVQFPAGTITGYQAAPGWDPVTGWGSPDAQVLVPLLARYA